MLALENVQAGYGPVNVLHGVSLRVDAGEIVTVLGCNGAGKSTTLMTICGINPARHGTITFAGQPITRLPAHEIVSRGLSQVPEGRRIFPRLTVRENLEMGAFHQPAGADLDRAFTLFPILKERQTQFGGTLSGGEQQMLAIARALMARPKLLLLDEPSLGLAPLIVAKIFEIIRGINAAGTTILLVEQNANMALHIAHRGYVLETGRIVLEDSAKNLMHNEQVKKSYLGG
ncbi:MAG: High-affinity branched-chain amino acid transport ATP-binding protein LivF [Verrucomicrobiae bacterium]|nr:High-affinity branched-chain amino acid transport ATP-binding protein LivF [Verrucomicrobiae bacterium]